MLDMSKPFLPQLFDINPVTSQHFDKHPADHRPKPNLGEIASTDSDIYTSWNLGDYNPDTLVQAKGGLHIYDKIRKDAVVSSCLALKKRAVLSAGWFVKPASDEQSDIDIAEFVEYVFEQMDGSINNVLYQILSAIDYGYSISEIVWKVFEDGKYRNKIGLQAIKSKRPHNFQFKSDKHSNLQYLIQDNDFQETKLPFDKFLIYSYNAEFGNHYGQSDLQAIYHSYWSKENLTKYWNIYLERFGMPIARGKVKGNGNRDQLMATLKNLQSKTSIVYEESQFEIDFLEAQRRSGGDYEAALQWHNRQIARALGVPDKIQEGGDSGAFAQAKVQMEAFMWTIKPIRFDIEETVMKEQLIRRLVDLNFANVEAYPEFKFKLLTEEERMNQVTAFIEAAKVRLITPTFGDEEFIRDVYGFPEIDEQERIDNLPQQILPEDIQDENEDEDKDNQQKMSQFVEGRDKDGVDLVLDQLPMSMKMRTALEPVIEIIAESESLDIANKRIKKAIKEVPNKSYNEIKTMTDSSQAVYENAKGKK